MSQQTQTDFGRNRIQLTRLDWSFYKTEQMDIYFYLGGQELGKYIIKNGADQIKWVENKLDYRISNKIQVLLFNDLNDVYQTNLGIKDEAYNIGGETKILGNKIFLYFNGDYSHLMDQLRKGLITVFINDMMYGGDIQDVVQNAVLMNLPDWYFKGLVEYLTEGWSSESDEKLRDGILSKRYKRFMKVNGEDPVFSGLSMWHFISKKYGDAAVYNVMYLTRVNRSLESGFLFVLGKTMKEVLAEWYAFYKSNYLISNNQKESYNAANRLNKRFKKHKQYYNFKLGPYGQKLAYVTNELGRYKLRIMDFETRKKKTVLRGGYKSIDKILDKSFPIIDWADDGGLLSVIYEHKDDMYLFDYNIKEKTKEKTKIEKFQKILDFSYMGNNDNILISAVNKGQSDLYTMYKPTQRLKRITNDPFDDLEPRYVKGSDFEGILYVSNRNNDTLDLPKNTFFDMHEFDVYYYDLQKKRETLARITETPGVREKSPMPYNQSHFSYLSDNGRLTYNTHVSRLDSVFARYDTLVKFKEEVKVNPNIPMAVLNSAPNDSIDSWSLKEVYRHIGKGFCIGNMQRGVQEQDRASKSNMLIQKTHLNKRTQIFREKVIKGFNEYLKTSNKNKKTISPSFTSMGLKSKWDKDFLQLNKDEKLDTIKFLSDFDFPEVEEKKDLVEIDTIKKIQPPLKAIETLILKQKELENTTGFRQSLILPYHVIMSTDYLVSQLDNSFMFTPYQHFTGGPVMSQTSLNPLIKLGIQDLFEDFKLVGGFRFPSSFSGSEYFISFQNLKRRLDKKLVLYRKSEFQVYDFNPFWYLPVNSKLKTNYAEASLSWPFSELARFKIMGGFRNVKYDFLATDTFSLNFDAYNEDWSFIRMEYVYDNTIPLGLNIWDGIRMKFYAETHYEITEKNSNIYVFGGDLRFYKKIHRQFIFANRLSFAKSLGSRRMIYYLGGVDNWVIPKFNYETPISQTQNYAFQALATNMRGFLQNIRNGNTFMVFNSELRLPIVRYLNLSISSEFLQQLQIIGFGDIGTAWVGLSPYSDENPLNSEDFEQGPISVNVQYVREPIVRSSGFGLRSKLFGYFIRGDVAWGFEDGYWNDPVYYISMTLDF